MPNTSTGPAILNILAPMPNTCPSALNSIAGDTIELEKPVMGTNVPAPANLAIFEKSPSDVKIAAAAINTIEAVVLEVSSENFNHFIMSVTP